jgi:uncharacterized protein (TIGR03067 family)
VAGGRRLVALELNGVKQELPHGQEDRVLIAGDRMIADNECFSFKLDPSTDPKLIDLVRLVGRDKGEVLEGIYQLRAEALTICLFGGDGVRSRPTEFSAKARSDRALFTLKRQKD